MRVAVAGLILSAAGAAVVAQQRAIPRGSAVAQRGASRPLRIVLVGDSTVNDEGGWGFAFKLWLAPGVECINTAANGRSSKSFIDEGRWAQALALRGDYYLIQFGHNDQPGKGPERETDPQTTFPAHLARYIDDARAIGAKPILVTSMTRRGVDANGRVVSTLGPWVSATRRVAAEKRVPVIDLDASSRALVERMGKTAWDSLSARNPDGTVDTTHLNTRGSLRTAPLVVDELRATVPALGSAFLARPWADAIVAADGSGDYATVQAAIDALPQNTTADARWVILVRAGTYREVVYVQREKRFVSLIGEDPARTTLTFDLHAGTIGPNGRPIGTFRTPTLQIDADDFSVENLTVENAAGPVGQALAVRVDGDRTVFRNVRLLGWQDTVFFNRGRQYVEDSLIAGHVDFIFGGATAFFERCRLHVWRDGYVTAASTPLEQPFGFVFDRARITGEPAARAYLGRPWRDFASVVFLRSEMSDAVRPEGWHNWDRLERERTARFAEFENSGRGALMSARPAWVRRLSAADARGLTPARVLGGGDRWNPLSIPARSTSAPAATETMPAALGTPSVVFP